MGDIVRRLKRASNETTAYEGNQQLCSDAADEIRRLKKENEKLRNALAPFSCLGVKELRPGDFNRARKAMHAPGQSTQTEK